MIPQIYRNALMKRRTPFAAFGIFCIMLTRSQGAVIYNESIDGDLSGLFGKPTPLSIMLGANTILAEFGNNGDTGATNGFDADYFTIIIDPGNILGSIIVESYLFAPNNPGLSFAAFTVAAAFAGQEEENVDGIAFFNASSGNILDDLLGDAEPLGAGVYSFWFQETSNNIVNYQLTFNVIPEPSFVILGASSLLAWLVRRRRW